MATTKSASWLAMLAMLAALCMSSHAFTPSLHRAVFSPTSNFCARSPRLAPCRVPRLRMTSDSAGSVDRQAIVDEVSALRASLIKSELYATPPSCPSHQLELQML
eukprot:1488296-Rhodomonas_salina.1